jgi:hypothetical protein
MHFYQEKEEEEEVEDGSGKVEHGKGQHIGLKSWHMFQPRQA